MFDLMPLAFFRPDVHQRSRSTTTELRPLDEVLMDAVALERSRAFRSLRSPTVSVFGLLQDRSAENMFTPRVEWSNERLKEVQTVPPQNERQTGEVP